MQACLSLFRNHSPEAKGRSSRLFFFAVIAQFIREAALLFSNGMNEATYALATFQMFEPNQSLEPTRMLVTVRADARPAPSTRVAHL